MLKAIVRISSVLMFFVFFSHALVEAQIAPGVQQSAAQTAIITGTVIQANGTPVIGAEVRLSGPAVLTTKSDAHGIFHFVSVPYGTYRIVAISTNLGTASRDAIALQGDMNVTIQYVTNDTKSGLKTIAQVSTHSAGASINVTPASIASVTPSDWAFQGNSSWQQLLNRIPGVTAGGDLTSYNGGPYGVGLPVGSPFQPVVLSINGALPYETSVTLDGMPIINESFATADGAGSGTDLSLLPMLAFDTADVVRGPGANAPSIVDSIGGSFVLHGPGQVEKNQFEFSMSNDPYGGIVSNVKAALRFGRLSATIIYGLNNSPGPLGTGRVISAPTVAPATINGQAFIGCGAAYYFGTCYAYPPDTGSSIYQGCYCKTVNGLLLDSVPSSTAWTAHNGALGLSYTITPSITAQVLYAGTSQVLPSGGVLVVPADFTPGPGYSGAISPGVHVFPGSFNYTTTQASSLLEEKITAYFGKGVLRLAAMQDSSYSQLTFPESPANGTYTLYGTGYYASAPSTPVNFNGTSAYLTFAKNEFAATYRSKSRDLMGSYAMPIGTTSTASISYVTSTYDAPSALVAYYYNGFNYCIFGICNERSNTAANSETTDEVRINAGTQISDKLSLDASWYIARGMFHVPDPNNPNLWQDSTFPYSAPRMSMVWRSTPDVVVRAAAGGSYALPNLFSLVGSNFSDCSSGVICYDYLTNLNLQPEHSFAVDIGTDMRLHRNTVVSFDFYNTNLYGQFFQGSYQNGTYLGEPLYVIETLNLAHSRMEGITASIHHDVPHGLYWNASFGLTRAYLVDVPSNFYNQPGVTCTPAAPGNCNGLTYAITGINFNGKFEAPVPYANGSAQIGYRWSAEKYIDLSPTFYGNNNLYFEPAFLELDAHAGYPITRNFSLLATFRNITGIYDQNYIVQQPSMGAPTYAGQPFPLYPIPYGPRSVIITANFKY